MTTSAFFLRHSFFHSSKMSIILLILFVSHFLSTSDSYDKLLTSNDEMVLSIDLSSIAKLPMRQELVIRVYNLWNNQVICQSYMVDQEEDGMFTCSMREPFVEFRNGPNYFAMEMVSVQTGKHYLRQTLPTIYHLDNTMYDGYDGSINATNPMVLINTLLVSGVSVAMKWGMDHLFNHVLVNKETPLSLFPPATTSPRPWQTIARKQIYRNPHHGTSLTHLQQEEQQHNNHVKSTIHSLPSQPSTSRILKKTMKKKTIHHHQQPKVISQPRQRRWKLPRPTNEQSKTMNRAVKLGFLLSLVYPAMKGSTLLLHTMVPQNVSIFHIPSLNQTHAVAFITGMGSLASKLLHREMKKDEKMYSYTTIDGYDIPLSSPLFGEAEDREKTISTVSSSSSSTISTASGKRNTEGLSKKNDINYYNHVRRWFQRTIKRLTTTPLPGKPRCPLRFFFGQ